MNKIASLVRTGLEVTCRGAVKRITEMSQHSLAALKKRRFVHALDSSECSLRALDWAFANVLTDDDHLYVVSVIHGKIMPMLDFKGSENWFVEEKETENVVLQQADELVHKMKAKHGKNPSVTVKVLWGDPRTAIPEIVSEIKPTMVIVGNRGLGKLKGMLMGSVSSFLLAELAVPTAVIK